jgi:arylsulfatase A-like enzyme/glyoxylase-like metal-dependent hydrolase (beta-lactamase superfamily II)
MRYRNIFKPTVIASIVTLAAIGFTSVATSVKAQIDERPNIVMIVADDMGYSDMGAYGGVIETPNLDSLTTEGIQFTNFHAGSICSPSRSMFTTGVDNHRAGMGAMIEQMSANQQGHPGYEGYLNDRVVTVATVLKDAGYHTYMVGKWHLGGAEGPEAGRLPGERGFERNFALLNGAGDYYSNRGTTNLEQCVHYVFDDQPMDDLNGIDETLDIALDGAPDLDLEEVPYYICEEEASGTRVLATITDMPDDVNSGNFYSTEFLNYQMIDFIEEDRSDGKPFFAFISYSTPHWPLQVPREYIDKYLEAGTFDQGWDVMREERFNQMQELGIISADLKFEDIPKWPEEENGGARVWDEVAPEEQQTEIVKMAAYAGTIDYMDEQIGQFIQYLKDVGEYDNTIIVFFADNGGDAHDRDNLPRYQPWFDDIKVNNQDDNIGNPDSFVTLDAGWTQVNMTPFWGGKASQAEGGVRAAFIVHFPKKIAPARSNAFFSVLDLAPTFLDYANTEHPGMNYDGQFIFPMDGKSLRPILEGWQSDIYRDNEHTCFEVTGKVDKSCYLGDWKILKAPPPWGEKNAEEADDEWRLYNLAVDPGETNNLAKTETDKLDELVAIYEEFEKDVGFVKFSNEREDTAPPPQSFKRPDSRITLHGDNIGNIPELPGIHEGITYQREEYVTSFEAGGEITGHVVWGVDDNDNETLYVFKTEEEVLTNLDKVSAKTLDRRQMRTLSQLPMVFEGILFSPDEYMTYFNQGLEIDMYLAVEQRYGYPVLQAFLTKDQLSDFYLDAQDKRCGSTLGASVIEKTDAPLEVDVYLSSRAGTYVTSVLIQGENDAILIGGQYLLSEAQNVVDWVEESGKTLKAIWITHGQPNRYLGLPALAEAFPDVPIYARADVIEYIRKTVEPILEDAKERFGDDMADAPVFPEPYAQKYLTVEGQCIEIMDFENIDGVATHTALYISSTKTLFASDIATKQEHVFLTANHAPYTEWREAIAMLKAMQPQRVITGHTKPEYKDDSGISVFDETLEYMDTFTRILGSANSLDEVDVAIKAAYPDYELGGITALALSTYANTPTKEACSTTTPLETDVYLSSAEGTYVTSALISGENGAILVGGQNITSEAEKVVEWVNESGKTLESIWITHAQPNRYIGLKAITDSFPDVPVYARQGVADTIETVGQTKLEEAEADYFGDVPDGIVTPQVYYKDNLVLEGQCVEIIDLENVDGVSGKASYTALHIPSTKTLYAADIVVKAGHVAMPKSLAPYTTWRNQIADLKAMDFEQVIPGHINPDNEGDYDPGVFDETLEYLDTVEGIFASTSTAEEAQAAIQDAYKDYILPGVLGLVVSSYYPPASDSSGSETSDSSEQTNSETSDSSEQPNDVKEKVIETEFYLSPISVGSTLITGETEAILVDGQMLLSDGEKVAQMIKDSGKNLKAIWITHGHPDHYFGTSAILEKFPGTPVYSTEDVVNAIENNKDASLASLKAGFGDDVADEPVVPEVFQDQTLEIDGQTIEILTFSQGDTEQTTALHIPDQQTIIAADILYCGVHAFVVEATTSEARNAWIDTIEQLKDLNPTTVIPGHKTPELDNSPACLDEMIEYLQKFEQVVSTETTAEDAIAAMQEEYPNHGAVNMLESSMQANYSD